MSGYRLAAGGVIDRERSVEFLWEGRSLKGHPGDSLASALIASGVRIVGRSFKYHRPRGMFSAGVEEPCAYVTLGTGAARTPNTKAPMVELVEGLRAQGQNAWPNVRFDIGAASGLLSPFLPAGFYYKTFVGPAKGTRFWMFCEHFIRRAAGMGIASRLPDPAHYERANAFCDLLIVGSGPAGLAAAETAGRAGMRVILAEQDFALGGSTLAEPESVTVEGVAVAHWRQDRLTALQAMSNVRIFPRTTVFGLYDGGVAGLHERLADEDASGYRGRFWVVHARDTLVAAGAHERGFAFVGNDRPGVMLASATRTYVNRFGVAPGKRIVVATNNDSGREVAADLAGAGLSVTLADARLETGFDGTHGGVTQIRGVVPGRVLGRRAVRGVELVAADGNGGPQHTIDCDILAVSGGWNPVLHLVSQRGVRPEWQPETASFGLPEGALPVRVAGAAAGCATAEACQLSGRREAVAVARTLGFSADEVPPAASAADGVPVRPLYEVRLRGDRGMKSFVDLQNDVTAADIRLAVQEGFDSPEHLKRYTTLGMSPDQGKTGNVIGIGILAECCRTSPAECGTTTYRPPFEPVEIGALAGRARGRGFRPVRRTPAHNFHNRIGAVMVDTGLWRRPWYYAALGEGLDEAYVREAETVRDAVGIVDVSTLGKIAVQGPDAGRFLDHVYVNGFSKLPVGRARYGVMLRDDGIVFDDGTAWRLAEHDYFVTATTAQAGPVMHWLEKLLATRFPHLRIHVTSVTDQWSGAAVAGPRSRDVLKAVVAGIDLSDEGLPFMGVREGKLEIGGGAVACRIARISFSGELGYEIYVEADYGEPAMDRLLGAVKDAGGAAYGLEALGALRIEKGHVTVAELDGRVTLADAGLGRMASRTKAYIGRTLSQRAELRKDNRPQLVGLHPVDPAERFSAGAIICAENSVAGHGEGWITGVTHSPALGHWIGIGFATGGAEAWKDRIAVAADPVRDRSTRIRVVSPHMFDAEGERIRG